MAKDYRKEAYYYGSEAPARETERPERVVRHKKVTKEEALRQSRELQAEENQRSATRFGFLYTMVIIAAVAIMGYNCVSYITTQSKHTDNAKQIAELEDQVAELKEYNDEKKLAIDTSIDYDYIYKVATKELGMVYPGEGQIVKYQSGESEYVIQYQDVE